MEAIGRLCGKEITMTIKQRANPSEDVVAIGGGSAVMGVAGCAAKYGAATVAKGATAMVATAGESISAIKLGASLGSFLTKVLCPEVAIVGGLVLLCTALYEVNE